MLPKRVLVTGASGLLGSAVVKCLSAETAVWAVGHRHAPPGMTRLDLAADGVAAAAAGEWDALVHCAAYRSPDFCEEHPQAAWRLNADVPRLLAEAAAARRARLVHISTDYVFPGTHPPYRETDACGPLNLYGRAKLHAEYGIAHVHPGAVILRIPALYGAPEPWSTAPLLMEGVAAAQATEPVELDDCIVRYPTHVDDVARVVRFILESDFRGVLHVSAGMPVTRYGWARLIAGVLGVETGHLRPSARALGRPAARPRDAHLGTDRLQGLGAPVPRDCDRVLGSVLTYLSHAGVARERRRFRRRRAAEARPLPHA